MTSPSTPAPPGQPRYDVDGDLAVCLDCGAFIADQAAHTRFHSILSSHAWLLAILKTAHVGPAVHALFDVSEREIRRKFDNWSADALADIVDARHPGWRDDLAGRGATDGGDQP